MIGKNNFFTLFVVTVFFTVTTGPVYSTPSTTFWTPSVMDIQPFGVFHAGIDNYSTIGKKSGQAFPVDYGITVGVLPFKGIKMEVGIDIIEPSDYPVYFNVKIGTVESKNLPAFNVGMFNAGTQSGVTDFNVLDVVAGKTLPFGAGRLHLGYYTGNSALLKDSSGKVDNSGFMAGYDRYLYKDKLMFAADYATGKNAVGGGGVGLYYFFTGNVSLLVGPVWFNDAAVNGDAKWTTQFDINF